jgi:hypothetical protein
MKSTLITVVLAAMPAMLAAQATGTSNGEVQGKIDLPSTYSASARTTIEAAFTAAHTKNLPDQILRARLAEAQAANAAEADVVTSIQKLETQLEETQQALVQSGRQNPTADEITAAATAMGRGLTAAQISALAKEAPADRSLAVSFNTLNKLAARGQPIDQALASVQAKLEAKATDDAIATLAGDAAAPSASPAAPTASPAAPAATNAAAPAPVNAAKDSAATPAKDGPAASAPKDSAAAAAPAPKTPAPAGVQSATAPKLNADSGKASPKKPAPDSAKAKPPVGKP